MPARSKHSCRNCPFHPSARCWHCQLCPQHLALQQAGQKEQVRLPLPARRACLLTLPAACPTLPCRPRWPAAAAQAAALVCSTKLLLPCTGRRPRHRLFQRPCGRRSGPAGQLLLQHGCRRNSLQGIVLLPGAARVTLWVFWIMRAWIPSRGQRSRSTAAGPRAAREREVAGGYCSVSTTSVADAELLRGPWILHACRRRLRLRQQYAGPSATRRRRDQPT